MAESPTQRTLAWCREQNWIAETVEHWQPSHSQRRVMDAAVALAQGRGGIADVARAVASFKSSVPGRRIDLFGFCDIVALTNGEIIAIQCTSADSTGARILKIKTECREKAVAWLKAGGRILVIGWRKYAKPVDRRFWRETVHELTIQDFEGGFA